MCLYFYHGGWDHRQLETEGRGTNPVSGDLLGLADWGDGETGDRVPRGFLFLRRSPSPKRPMSKPERRGNGQIGEGNALPLEVSRVGQRQEWRTGLEYRSFRQRYFDLLRITSVEGRGEREKVGLYIRVRFVSYLSKSFLILFEVVLRAEPWGVVPGDHEIGETRSEFCCRVFSSS